MDFKLTTEQELFKRALREYCEKNIAPQSREIEEKGKIPEELINGLADIGIFGITIPEEYGGSAKPGEEMQYANIAIHEIARAELSMALPVYILLTIGWGGQFLKLYAQEEIKKEILPRLASGEWFWGINVTEPGGGSDVATLKCSAVKSGDEYILNGEKAFISGVKESKERGGGHCSLFVTDPEIGIRGGMTFYALPATLSGISFTTYDEMGRKGLSSGSFFYDDVKLTSKYILGEEGKGFYCCMEGFNIARALVASACLGAAEKCLEIGVEYIKQRKAFGKPIGKFEGLSFEAAEDYTRLEMLKLLLQKGMWTIDQFYQPNSSITYKDVNVIIAQCKWLAPLLGVEIAKHVMMWHGALGYTKDLPLEMALRAMMSYTVGAEGTANIMKLIVVRDAFGNELVSTRP